MIILTSYQISQNLAWNVWKIETFLRKFLDYEDPYLHIQLGVLRE